MNEQQYLLTCIAEAASEVVKDATKAIRFGLYDFNVHNGNIPNAQRLIQELNELNALVKLAGTKGFLDISMLGNEAIENNKIMKYEKYAQYARDCGTLDVDWDKPTTSKVCINKNVNGVCLQHNLHCGYPACEK